MESDPHHRKIDLQSPADLTYLLTNIRASAQEKVDNAFPASAAPKDGDDAIKAKVQSLVHEYINSTLSLALPSLALNGLPASPAILAHPTDSSLSNPQDKDPNSPSTSFLQSVTAAQDDENSPSSSNYEPYDPRLAQKLRECYALLEEESTRVAELRREGPGAAGRKWIEGYEKMEEEEREAQRRWEEGVLAKVKAGEEERVRGLGRVERVEEMRGSWEGAVKGLRELERGIGATVGKVERVEEVVGVIRGG